MNTLKLYLLCSAVVFIAQGLPLLQRDTLENFELSEVLPTKEATNFDGIGDREIYSVEGTISSSSVARKKIGVKRDSVDVPLNAPLTGDRRLSAEVKNDRFTEEVNTVQPPLVDVDRGEAKISERQVTLVSKEESKTDAQRKTEATAINEGKKNGDVGKGVPLVASNEQERLPETDDRNPTVIRREDEGIVEGDNTFRETSVALAQGELLSIAGEHSIAPKSEKSPGTVKPLIDEERVSEQCNEGPPNGNAKTSCTLTPTVIVAKNTAAVKNKPSEAPSTGTVLSSEDGSSEKVDSSVHLEELRHDEGQSETVIAIDESLSVGSTALPSFSSVALLSSTVAPSTTVTISTVRASTTGEEVVNRALEKSNSEQISPGEQLRAEGNETDRIKATSMSEIWDELARHDVSSETFDADCCLCEEDSDKAKQTADDALKAKQKSTKIINPNSKNIAEDHELLAEEKNGGNPTAQETALGDGDSRNMQQRSDENSNVSAASKNRQKEGSKSAKSEAEGIKSKEKQSPALVTADASEVVEMEEVLPVVITDTRSGKGAASLEMNERISEVRLKPVNISTTPTVDIEEAEDIDVDIPERSFWERLVVGLKCSHRDCADAFKHRHKPRKQITPTIIRRARERLRAC